MLCPVHAPPGESESWVWCCKPRPDQTHSNTVVSGPHTHTGNTVVSGPHTHTDNMDHCLIEWNPSNEDRHPEIILYATPR